MHAFANDQRNHNTGFPSNCLLKVPTIIPDHIAYCSKLLPALTMVSWKSFQPRFSDMNFKETFFDKLKHLIKNCFLNLRCDKVQ